MGPDVRLRDGVHVEGDRHVVFDARSATGDVTVVSHAHADHGRRATGTPVICSTLTAALLEARTGVTLESVPARTGIRLRPSGHVPGARAAVVEVDGTRVLYTGDVSTRDRGPQRGFEPVGAEVLVVEATYGHPDYRFRPQPELEARVRDFIADTEGALVLFGYSLGRAQTLQRLAREATARRLVVHPQVRAVNQVLAAHTDRTFPARSWTGLERLRPDDVVIAPLAARRDDWFAAECARHDPVTAAFSGWSATDRYRHRLGVDEAFVLSDHCDFDELVELVRAVDPTRVYTHHGFATEFAAHLSAAHGYDAVALRRGQRRLEEYA